MILLLDIILLSRFLFLPPDRALTGRRLTGLAFVQAAGFILFRPGITLLAGFLLIAGISAWMFFADRTAPRDRINRNRAISLAIIYFVLNVLFSPAVDMQPGVIGAAAGAIAANLLALIPRDPVILTDACVYLLGILLVTGETNYFVRWILGRFHLVVENNPSFVDDREFNAGRIIGIIERLLIYQLMLLGAYTAIGFVLAAKGFTRFRELDERVFAEYVLVGTLLSTACSVFIALAIGLLL